MSLISPLLVILAIVLLYLNIGGVLAAVGLAIKTKRTSTTFGAIAVTLICFLAYLVSWRFGAMGITSAGAAVAILNFFLYRSLVLLKADWRVLKDGKEGLRQTLLHLALVTGSFVFLVPFAWLISTSLKEDKDMSAFPPIWIPTQQVKIKIGGVEHGLVTLNYQGKAITAAVMEESDTGDRILQPLQDGKSAGETIKANKDQITEIRRNSPVWKNYPDALKFLPPETNFGLVFLKNTLIVSVLGIFGTLLSCSMVSYGFSRLKFPGRDQLFVVLLATMMLPSAVTMMPVFLIFRWLGWIDSLRPLWVPSFFGAAYYIFLLRQFFLGIPNELEDAAKIDGCSPYGIFWRIMLPQVKPALAAITILSFMAVWNDFRGPLIYISSPEKETLAYALQLFQTAHGSEPALLMAASTMMIVPILALFFFTQRYFIQGITLTGIKG